MNTRKDGQPVKGTKKTRKDGLPTPAPTWSEGKQAWVNSMGQPVCGAKKVGSDQICAQPKGFKTDHPGFGRCTYHGGSAPNGVVAAMKEKLKRERPIYGSPLNIGPHEAILMEVQHTAGHVAWLRNVIRSLGSSEEFNDDDPDSALDEEWGDPTPRGAGMVKTLIGIDAKGFLAPSVWIQMYENERKHLVSVCKAAVTMGVAERQVRLAEEQGQLIATVVLNIFNDPDLGLNAAQRNALPDIARRHFGLISAQEAQGALPNPHRTPDSPKSAVQLRRDRKKAEALEASSTEEPS